MKRNLIIKLNDVLVNTSASYNKAIKKSIEFFLGSVISSEDLNSLKSEMCSGNSIECIQKFLNGKNIFIRDNAVSKKLREYYSGKDFRGTISDCSLLIDKTEISRLSENFNLTILSIMPKEEADFLVGKNKLKADLLYAGTIKEGITKVKNLNLNASFLGNSIDDYNSAIEENIPFIGLNMKKEQIPKGTALDKIEELL
jgi:histidinol-phosphate aminotransferase